MKNKLDWLTLATKNIFKSKFFTLRVDKCQLQDGRVMPEYYVMDFPDWVQVVALDHEQKLILVHQYRYPAHDYFIEFPGGATHPDSQEDHKLAASRELLEETGYATEEWSYLGFHYPNPALMGNKCHVYMAKNCKLTAPQNLDPFEVIDVHLYTIEEFQKKIKSQSGMHSIMLATYHLAMPAMPLG